MKITQEYKSSLKSSTPSSSGKQKKTEARCEEDEEEEDASADEVDVQGGGERVASPSRKPNDIIATFMRESGLSSNQLPVAADQQRLSTLRQRKRVASPPPPKQLVSSPKSRDTSIYDVTDDGDMSAYAADVMKRHEKSRASRSQMLMKSVKDEDDVTSQDVSVKV